MVKADIFTRSISVRVVTWIAAAVVVLCLPLIAVIFTMAMSRVAKAETAADTSKVATDTNGKRIDSLGLALQTHAQRQEVDGMKRDLQLAEIAKSVGAPVLVDTTRNSIRGVDSL